MTKVVGPFNLNEESGCDKSYACLLESEEKSKKSSSNEEIEELSLFELSDEEFDRLFERIEKFLDVAEELLETEELCLKRARELLL